MFQTFVESTMLQRVIRYGDDRGAPMDDLLEEVGITRAEAADPETLTYIGKAAHLHQLLAESLGDPALGLGLAASARPRDYGVIGLLFQHADTTLRAFQILAGVYGQLLADAWLAVEMEGDHVRIEHGFQGDTPGLDLIRQDALAAFFLQSRRASGGGWTPMRVAFRQRAVAPERFREVFGVDVEFGAREDEMVVRREWLDVPSPAADPLLLAHLRAAAEVSLTKRRAAAGRRQELLRLKGCTVDVAGGVVFRGKDVLYLTSRERQLLEVLASRPNELVTQEELERDVWRIGKSVVTHAPAVAVRRLRQKIEPLGTPRPVNLLTIYGEGWKLVTEPEPPAGPQA